MTDCPIPNDDLVALLQQLYTGRIRPGEKAWGDATLDVGGTDIHGEIIEPLEAAKPLVRIKTDLWTVQFRIPKNWPQHMSIVPRSRVYIEGIVFEGDAMAMLRDVTFAKMLA